MNAFRQLLKAAGAHPPVGSWVTSGSAIVAEAIAHAGFDWAVLDMEHSPADLSEVVQMLHAVSGTKLVPVVRVPWNDAVMVKRVLDAGAPTLLFPFVQNGDEAARAVAATRYPPQGVRGISTMSRANRFGTVPNYFAHANQQVGVIVQIETMQAVQHLDEIARTEGVDAVFLGPADLSASMGLLGQPTHPQVMDVMAKAAQRCKAIGKPVGTVGGTPEVVAQYRAAGFDFVAVSSDLGLLMQAARNALAALRTPDSDHVHSISSGTRGY